MSSQLVDLLVGAKEFDFGEGKKVSYREITLDQMKDVLREAFKKEKKLSGDRLEAAVARAFAKGDNLPQSIIPKILYLGLIRDNPDLTEDEIPLLFTKANGLELLRLAQQIMGATDEDVRKAQGKAARADGKKKRGTNKMPPKKKRKKKATSQTRG